MQGLLGALIQIFRIGLSTWKQMRAVDAAILASSLAFTTVISLVPLLAVSLSVFKALGGFEVLMKQLEPFIIENLVEASGAHVSKFIRASLQRVESGALGLTGVIALFISSTKLFFDMDKAVRRVWQESDRGLRWRRLLVYWVVMFVGPLVLAIALGLVGSKGWTLINWIPKKTVAMAIIFVSFLFINKFVPIARVAWRSAVLSAAFAAIGIALAQEFYAQVTKDVLRYSKIYGSLASIPIFLLWILVLWWIALASVALCAVLEAERRKRI